MKKLILVLLSVFILSSCNSNSNKVTPPKDDKAITETPATKKYEINLNKSNLWRFVDSEYSPDEYINNYRCIYVFRGVLSYAYYDNVVIYLKYKIICRGGFCDSEPTYYANIEVKLNAAGNGGVSLDRKYIPRNITPAFNGESFDRYNRSLSIESISGTVRFNI